MNELKPSPESIRASWMYLNFGRVSRELLLKISLDFAVHFSDYTTKFTKHRGHWFQVHSKMFLLVSRMKLWGHILTVWGVGNTDSTFVQLYVMKQFSDCVNATTDDNYLFEPTLVISIEILEIVSLRIWPSIWYSIYINFMFRYIRYIYRYNLNALKCKMR